VEEILRHERDDLLSFVRESILYLRLDTRKPATDYYKEALLLLKESNSKERY
jgi:hypothetical protein